MEKILKSIFLAILRFWFYLRIIAIASLVLSCEEQGTQPIIPAPTPCTDPSVLELPRFSVTKHKHPVRVKGAQIELAGTTWAKGDSVLNFFGGKDIKLVFTLNRQMYLVSYVQGIPTISRISQNDEGVNGFQGSINSPLFSPDGKKVVFAGTSLGKPAFIQDAVSGDAEAWRVPLDPKARVTADPHWHSESGKNWIYFSTRSGLVGYVDKCQHISGNTYRVEISGDTTVGPIETTGIAGAYRGGISRDGIWAGTSYATSALFNLKDKVTRKLANGEQQCNPSMNPFPIGSEHTDYMMILAFGGVNYTTIEDKPILEDLHENLWIYNKDDKIVWQGKRPNEKDYLRWDKPEWSTDPNYATAIGLVRSTGNGDLFVIKIGDLANAKEGKLNQAQGYLKIGTGGFNSDAYSHLWVAP